MRKHNLLKSTLCLLMALVCNVAWAQPKASPAPVDGQWAEGTVWYQIKTANGYYFRSDRLNNGTLNLDQTTPSNGAAGLWCFVGTETEGYKLYNKEKGATFSLGKSSTNAQFVENGTTAFDFATTNVGENYRCLKEHGTEKNYLNRNGGNGLLTFWNSTNATNNDNGSALLFAEVDLNALTVTNLEQLSNDKVYTLRSQRAQLYYNHASWISSSNSITYDRNDPKQQFRIEEHDGKYYFYSVGAGKYLDGKGNYVDNIASAAAVTLNDVSGTYADYPWKPKLGDNYLNSQDNGGLLVNTYSNTDTGNSYKIEVGNVYSVHVLGEGVEETKVTIKGKEYQDGDMFAKKEDIQSSDVVAPAIEGKTVVVTVDGSDISVTYWDNTTQFYTIKGGHGGFVSLADGYHDAGRLKLTNTARIRDKQGLWYFKEDADGAYIIYNFSTGLSKVLGMKGDGSGAQARMVAADAADYTKAFDGTFNFDGTASFIKLKGSANNYWNRNGGTYLALWNSISATDQGSQFFMKAVNFNDFVDVFVPEVREELAADKIKGVTSFTPENANTLWYKTSAEASGVSYPWMEYALPLGNGELGCMVFGGVAYEELQFNEKTLWSGPTNTIYPGAGGGGQRTFVNFGSVFVKNLDETLSQGVTDYVRYLDIEEGIAGVEFKNANGTKQLRKYLSSAPDQVIAAQYKITEGNDKLNLLFQLEPEDEINPNLVKYENGMAYFTGAMTVEYAARLHVVAKDGTVTTDANGIRVENATEVTFYLKGATNFDGDKTNYTTYFTDDTAEEVNADVKSAIETAAKKGFETVETEHVNNFKEITGRMTFSLGLTTPAVDTKTLIDNYYPNNENADSRANDHLFLEQLYFHYGRYLAISSNRQPIAAPNNLQGIWNDRASDSPWNSDVHTNINIQMNYWPTEITNLSDLHVPFLNFIIRGAQTEGWKNVSKQYNNNGPGWSILTETSLYGSMSDWGSNYLVANVWYTSHLWTHYRYTQDKEFLKEAFPVMWSAAEFWFHRLIEDTGDATYDFAPDGTYVAPNEYSAEQNDHPSENGTAHAQQMISYLFENISEAISILGAEELGLNQEDVNKLNRYLEKTDKGLHTEEYTGKWGDYNGVTTDDLLLREWKYAPYSVSNERGHRHMSHLMALFPMDQITPESPYFEPAVNSLKLRGDEATGWSMGWKVNLWARAQDGDHAHLIIKNALRHSTAYTTNQSAGGIYYNLFDSHAPFQIDGNFGVCSGMAEMLLQSAHGYINILPAMPKAWENKGEVTGMKAIGNFTVSFNWKDGKAQKATIVSHKGAPLKVRCKRGAMDIADAFITVNGTEVLATVENGIATIPNVKENDEVVIDFTKRRSVAVKVYTPGKRATTLENGKKYLIYNTAFNGSEDRTGFLYDTGSGIGHSGSPKKKPSTFKTTSEAYLWEVVTTEESAEGYKYYLKAANGGYVNASGKTNNAEVQAIYIQPWSTSQAPKAGVKSESTDGSVIENANIGVDVWTICGTSVTSNGQSNGNGDCWNGNANTWAKWASAHPYAFYEVTENEVMFSDAFPLPGKTYYIYCDNDNRQYFYNDGGTLKISEKRTEWSNEYLFTCSFDGQYFQFKNMKGKYLAHKGLSDNAHNFELAEYLDGVNLKTPGGSYFVMTADGGFDQSSKGEYDPKKTGFSTVYKFEEFNFPVDGETYYIYSDTYYNNEYVNRYMYVDGSSLKTNTSLSTDAAYQWTCIVTEDGKVQFKNGNGKYLKHKGIQDASYDFTLNKANATHAIAATLYSAADGGRYFVVKNNGAEFNQATSTYNQTNSDWCTDFVFMPVNEVKVLTVNGSNKAEDATATWNGETKALPASWVITPQTIITDATLSVNAGENFVFNGFYENGTALDEPFEICSLEQNCTVTARLTPSFFSASTSEDDLVPVRIRNVSKNSYTLRLNASDNYVGKAVNSGVTAYGENEIWYLVGTEESFKIYNRVAGTNLHIVLAGTGQNAAASMNTTADNADFCLVAMDNGYAICPKANTGQSFNMHGGAGNDIKLYGVGDGSRWIIEKMDVDNTLTFSVSVKGETWKENRGVGAIAITVNGIAGKKNIEDFAGEQKCYLPLNGTFTIASDTYRGYTFNGFNVNGTTVETLADQTLSEGLTVVAHYTANDEKVLFYSRRDGHPYRIPAIATAPNGDIFAICDYRPCNADIGNGDVDIVCRISSDNGETWSDEMTLADGDGGSTNRMETGYGDPAIVVDRESNKILVMMVAGRTVCGDSRWDASKEGVKDAEKVNRAARIYGTYNEESETWEWTQPVEVTDDIYKLFLDENNTATVTSYFIGSGKICQSRVVKKDEYYRLYCALWTRDGGNRVIYSDDFGMKWHVLGAIKDRPASGGNEPKCEELPDGTIVLSSRVGGGRYFNLFKFADNTYTTGTWGTVANSTTAVDGSSQGTNGEIYKVKAIKADGTICDVMLQSIPAGPGRSNVTVWYKEMEYNADGTNKYQPADLAADWKVGKQVSYKGSAYSTMHLQADGRIAFFFEEEPSDYSMVYIPYTLEDLTDEKYSLYTVTSTIGQYEIGTFYASEAMQIPEGVTAYVATESPVIEGETGYIQMEKLEGIIPAHTGAVIRSEVAKTYSFIPSISYGAAVEGNRLKGFEAMDNNPKSYDEITVAKEYTTYVLTVQNEKAGFYRKVKDAKFKVYNNKAYLDLSEAVAGAPSFAIRFEDEETTGIESIDNSQQAVVVYDLMGRRVEKMEKGVYIVNGKKVIVK